MERDCVLFDLDGVIADLVTEMLPLLSDLCGRPVHYSDIHDHDIPSALGLSISDTELYRMVEAQGAYANARPIAGAIEVLQGLPGLWTVVTSRPLRLRSTTMDWLRFHVGCEVRVRFAERLSKYSKVNARLVIDDDPVALRAASRGPKKLIFNQPWNLKSRFPRMLAWNELERWL